MRTIISALLTFGICGTSYGQEIQLIAPRIVCFDTKPNGESSYRLNFALLNASEKPITVVTGGYSKGIQFGEPSAFMIDLSKATVSGSLIVPSVSDLSLVELHPGESALIGYTTSADLDGKTAVISYNVDDTFSERYGFWSGYLKTDVFEIVAGRNCAL